MKYLVFSDLHGSIVMLNKIIKIFEEEKCDHMLFLGDLLYHGPRNDLPEGYNPKEVAKVINNYKDKITWVRGNCDGRVDEMVTGMKIKNTRRLKSGQVFKNILLTHGDLFKVKNNSYVFKSRLFTKIVFYGHTHVFECKKVGLTYYINPGSITIPKDGNKSYIIYDKNTITRYDENKNVLFTQELK